MNYRHIFHAGNFADVAKHVGLVCLLERLAAKEQELETALERWTELEGQREAMKSPP